MLNLLDDYETVAHTASLLQKNLNENLHAQNNATLDTTAVYHLWRFPAGQVATNNQYWFQIAKATGRMLIWYTVLCMFFRV